MPTRTITSFRLQAGRRAGFRNYAWRGTDWTAGGRRRIGYVHVATTDPMLGDNWLGGYLSHLFEHRLDPMVFCAKDNNLDGLLRWVEKRRPDALVVHSAYPGKLFEGHPAQPEIFVLNLDRDEPGKPGLVTSCMETGMNATDLLIGQLRRGERGIPPFQKTLRTQSK